MNGISLRHHVSKRWLFETSDLSQNFLATMAVGLIKAPAQCFAARLRTERVSLSGSSGIDVVFRSMDSHNKAIGSAQL